MSLSLPALVGHADPMMRKLYLIWRSGSG